MAKSKPSPQGQRLLDYRREHPEATAADIAEALKTTVSGVYQAESRLRADGHLPRLRAARYGKGKARKTRVAAAAAPPPSRVAVNGSDPDPVEKLIDTELTLTTTRIEEIEAQVSELTAEGAELKIRRERLTNAQAALASGARTALAAAA